MTSRTAIPRRNRGKPDAVFRDNVLNLSTAFRVFRPGAEANGSRQKKRPKGSIGVRPLGFLCRDALDGGSGQLRVESWELRAELRVES